jgi:hypothetical protein
MEVTLHRITVDAPNLHLDFDEFGVRLLRGARVPGGEMGWRWGATYGPCSTVDLTSTSEALSARPTHTSFGRSSSTVPGRGAFSRRKPTLLGGL